MWSVSYHMLRIGEVLVMTCKRYDKCSLWNVKDMRSVGLWHVKDKKSVDCRLWHVKDRRSVGYDI